METTATVAVKLIITCTTPLTEQDHRVFRSSSYTNVAPHLKINTIKFLAQDKIHE